jgi:hypothetical protein
MHEYGQNRGLVPNGRKCADDHPPSWHADVWTEITRMLTLNGVQSAERNQDVPLPDAVSTPKRTRVELSTSCFVDSATYCQTVGV